MQVVAKRVLQLGHHIIHNLSSYRALRAGKAKKPSGLDGKVASLGENRLQEAMLKVRCMSEVPKIARTAIYLVRLAVLVVEADPAGVSVGVLLAILILVVNLDLVHPVSGLLAKAVLVEVVRLNKVQDLFVAYRSKTS